MKENKSLKSSGKNITSNESKIKRTTPSSSRYHITNIASIGIKKIAGVNPIAKTRYPAIIPTTKISIKTVPTFVRIIGIAFIILSKKLATR